MTGPREPVAVWVTKLSVLAIPALLTASRRHGRVALYATASTWPGRMFAEMLRALGVLTGAPVYMPLTAYGARTDDPNSGFLEIQGGMSDFSSEFFSTNTKLLERVTYPDPRVHADRVRLNLRKAILQTTHDLLSFVEFARLYHRVAGTRPPRLIILSRDAVVANSIKPGWAPPDVEFLPVWSPQHSVIAWLGRSLVRFLTEAFRPYRPQRSSPSSIAVSVAWGLDDTAKLNDLYWWPPSGIPPERVWLCFERGDYPAEQDVIRRAEQQGFHCVVLHRQGIGDSRHLRWRPAPGMTTALARFFQKLKMGFRGILTGPAQRWTVCRMLQMQLGAEARAEFMREFNIRAFIHWQDVDIDDVSIACDMAGAARIGHQWSNLSWPMEDQVRLHHVYFAWGAQPARALIAAGSCIDHLLLSGCIIRCASVSDGLERTMAQQISTQLAAAGATRVLALFDMSMPSDRFYQFFFERVIREPHWGLVIKPKTSLSRISWMSIPVPEIYELYKAALETGRVCVLDRRVSSVEAAAAADFSVGLGINTATIIAALAGYRAIHLDSIRLLRSRFGDWQHFDREGRDRLVFYDPDTLWQALNRHFDEPGTETELGRMGEALLAEIDPFRDGRAGERIGSYVRRYLSGLDKELDREQALCKADEWYRGAWGPGTLLRTEPSGVMAGAMTEGS